MIILYNPQSSANRKPILPMSLLAIGAVLEGHYDYCIVDGNLETDPFTRLDQLIQAHAPRAVLALTVMPGPQLEQAVPLCQALRHRHPDLAIIWGGYFPTQHWDVALKADYVDYCLRAHSEYAFLQLLDWLHSKGTLSLPVGNWGADSADPRSAIPGLAYRNEAGQPVSNPLPPIPRPHTLPPWNFDQVEMARYPRRTFLGQRTLGYHSSYGCPFFCNFCAVVNMVNGRWFPQTAEQVAHIARQYKERWQIDAIEFYDNNFFTSEKRVAEFSRQIMGLGLAWWGEGRIDTMINYAESTWRLMRDSGLKMVFLGAESGSMETLQRMDKGGQMSPEKTIEMVQLMQKWDIVPELSFVMGSPPNPESDTYQTMEFIRRIKRLNPKAEIIMYLYTPVPLAGDLYDEAKADGFAFPQTLEEWVSPAWANFSQRRSTTMPWIKQPLQGQIKDFERVLNAYYPTFTDARLTQTWRTVIRAVSAWRYHSRIYRYPLELRALHRLIAYQRPETAGF